MMPGPAKKPGTAVVRYDPSNQPACGRMEVLLRTKDDPEKSGKRLAVVKVHRVYEPDARGLQEVLFMAPDNEALTAWVKGRELIYVESGW